MPRSEGNTGDGICLLFYDHVTSVIGNMRNRRQVQIAPRIMRKAHFNALLALIYATFAFAGAHEIYLRIRFHDVQNWPSVPARIVSAGGGAIRVRNDWWSAPRTGMVDASHVEFEYSVGNKTYRGDRGSPNGGGLPMNVFNEPWRAFYKPTSPHVAVLAPVPYQAGGWVLATFVSGVVEITQLWFVVPEWLASYRAYRHGRPGCAR